MKYAKSIWVCLFFIALIGCTKSDSVALGDIQVGLEEEIILETGLMLKVLKVEDSRCAVDAVCVWEGQALVTVFLEYKDKAETIQIARCNGSSSLCEEAIIEIFEHRIEVLDVRPFPVLDVVVDDEDWEIVLNISQI